MELRRVGIDSLGLYASFDGFRCCCQRVGGFVDCFCGLEDELVLVVMDVVIGRKESSGVSEQCNCCS